MMATRKPTDQPKGEYAIAISGLSDGDDLACSKSVIVSWQKTTAADTAVLWLDCDCTEHPNRDDLTWPTPTTDASGTYTFTLDHATRIPQADRTVKVSIRHDNVEQKNDLR